MTTRARERRLSIAVVQGGPSSEAEVSRVGAAGVAHALREAGHQVARIELDPRLPESLRTGGYEVVFPVVHGAVGEDGALSGMLEVLEMPYVGSNVLASALAMDKRLARRVFELEGLPVAKGLALARGDHTSETRMRSACSAAAERARREIGARLVVKPSSHGSAIGVTRLDESAALEEVARALELVWSIDDVAIVEHFARGREVTCGVLDLHGAEPVALPPTEITSPKDAFYTYEARYAPGRSVHTCPAPLGELTAQVQNVALRAHRALGCRDLSRVDFVVGDEDDPQAVTLLEVNTMPGMTSTSLYPEEAAARGLSFSELCDALVQSAHARGTTRRVQARPLPR
jgi:D-alanine-D-alanine ligase